MTTCLCTNNSGITLILSKLIGRHGKNKHRVKGNGKNNSGSMFIFNCGVCIVAVLLGFLFLAFRNQQTAVFWPTLLKVDQLDGTKGQRVTKAVHSTLGGCFLPFLTMEMYLYWPGPYCTALEETSGYCSRRNKAQTAWYDFESSMDAASHYSCFKTFSSFMFLVYHPHQTPIPSAPMVAL